MRIGLVTEEFAGLTGGGGIGTCARGLAITLVRQGHEVEVVITNPANEASAGSIRIGDRDVKVVSVADLFGDRAFALSDYIVRAYCIYEFLKERDYDVVHLNEWRGSGYYFAMAKRQGLVRSFVVTNTHGSSEWVRKHNLTLPDLHDLELEAIERSQIENSDLVVSPSQYLLDWYRSIGLALPPSEVVNWNLPQWSERSGGETEVESPLRTRAMEAGSLRELVYFGRQEPRKGFPTFVAALAQTPELTDLNVTFLGRFDRLEREFTGSYALRRLARHKGTIRFVNELSQPEALDYISRRPGALCVMPSAIENSPCTVGECLTLGLPFVATAVGGIPEMLEPDSAQAALCPPEAAALGRKLVSVRERGLPALHSRLAPDVIAQRWGDLHDEIAAAGRPGVATGTTPRAAAPAPAEQPLVTICLIHHERPELLRRALAGIAAQTYRHVEVVLVDDGSTSPPAVAALAAIEAAGFRFPLKLIRSENKYLGAARNLAAAASAGEWLIFHDDDNIAEPHQIETFVAAACRGRYDILTSQYLVFHDPESPDTAKVEYYPIGIGGVFSLFRNRFGDANCIVRRSTFEAVGGFSELRGVGWEDWEFFLKAYFAGFQVGLVPDPLFRYRVSPGGMMSSGSPILNNKRILDAAAAFAPRFYGELLEYAKRDEIPTQALDKTWYVLGQEVMGDVHRELMAAEPNSDEARGKLIDIAFAMGRTADAVELSLTSPKHRDSMFDLLRAIGGHGSDFYGMRTLTRETTRLPDRHAYLEGWMSGLEVAAEGPAAIVVGDDLYEIVAWSRTVRPDVDAALGATDGLARGFMALASKHAAPPELPTVVPLVHPGVFAGLVVPGLELQAGEVVTGFIESVTAGSYYRLEPIFEPQSVYTERLELVSGSMDPPLLHVGLSSLVSGKAGSNGRHFFSLPQNLSRGYRHEDGVRVGAFLASDTQKVAATVFQRPD